MHENKPAIERSSSDPDAAPDFDEAPEWTEEMFDAAEVRDGDKVIRPARGKLGPNGVVWFDESHRKVSPKAA